MNNIYLDYAKKMVRMVFGLFLCGFAIVLSIQANLGLSPWDVFHYGIAQQIGTTIGRVNIVAGFFIVIVDAIMKEKIGVGTITNMFLIGTFMDLIMSWNIIPAPENIVIRICMVLACLVLVSFGVYFYISNGLGGGPRDSFMLVLLHRTKLKVYSARILIEGTVFVIGYLLGGPVGIGTVIAVVCSGPIMDIVFRFLKFDVSSLKHESLKDTFENLRKG